MLSREQEFARKLEKYAEMAPENRHSYFQLKYFVVGKEPTLQGQLWQCLRELQARKETLDNLELEIADVQDQIDLVDVEKQEELLFMKESSYDAEKQKIKERKSAIVLRRLDRRITSLEKTLAQLEKRKLFVTQEARFFMQAFEGLEKIDKVKDYDDLESQQEYWNESVGQKINLKMLLQQPLDTELVQTALALHDTAPVKLQMTQMLDRIQHQLILMREQRKGLKKEKDDQKAIEPGPAVQAGELVGVPPSARRERQPVLREEQRRNDTETDANINV